MVPPHTFRPGGRSAAVVGGAAVPLRNPTTWSSSQIQKRLHTSAMPCV